ncbi:hypothetical protein FPV67DRAFT_738873 [Lyophyllum atratum]|nr:hypothetical protein FPV67DRAFT_738873 [Lyophyllum atratum]
MGTTQHLTVTSESSSTMYVYASLPQELIDKIIEALDGAEMQRTLHACCTVSSSFCNAAQKVLYRSISVSFVHRKDVVRTKALESSLMSSSHLSTYVDSISILIDPEHYSEISLAALPKLDRLRSIKIECPPELIDWSALPDTFKHDVSTVLRFPTLHDIRLSHMYNFPLSYLCASLSLQKLDVLHSALLGDVVFDNTDHPPPSIKPKIKGSLRTLITRESVMHTLYPALLSPLSPLHISGVKELAATLWNDANVIGLNSLLSVAASSLQTLCIEVDATFPLDCLEMPLELGSLENLRNIAFQVQRLGELRYVASLCESLRNANHLDEVTFTVGLLLCGLGNVEGVDEATLEWRRIDEYLSAGHGTWPLRLIRVVPIRVPHGIIVPAYFEKSMPRIYSAGRLRV